MVKREKPTWWQGEEVVSSRTGEAETWGRSGAHWPVSLVKWNVPGLVRDHEKGKEK